MPSRDVEINLVAHDRTGAATRSAARNLDQLARKVEKTQRQTQKLKIKTKVDVDVDDSATRKFANRFSNRAKKIFDKVKVKIKVDVEGDNRFIVDEARKFANRFSTKARKIFGRGGQRSGAAFMAGFLKTVTFGQIGQGFARGAIKAAPAVARAGGLLGVAMAGALVLELTQALSAAVPLALGGLLLAPSVVFLLRAQTEGLKQIKIQDKRVASIKKQIAAAEARDARLSGRSGDSAKAKQARQDHINDLKKTLAAEKNIRAEYERQAGALNQLKAKAKSFLTFVSEPVKIPLTDALGEIGKGFDRLKGPFREFTAALGPALAPFAKGIMDSLGSFLAALKPALPNIVAGFREWGRVMPQITGSVGNLLARLSAHPEAVQGFADSFDTFVGTAGDVIVGLQGIAREYSRVEALIRGGRTGQWGDEWTKVGGKAGAAAKKVGEAQLFILRKYDDMLQGIRSIPGSPFDKLKNNVHEARLQMEAEFAGVTTAKKKMDTALSSGPNKIQLKADDTDLTAKIIVAKKRLKEVNSAKARAKIEADISRWRAQRAIVRADLHLLDNTTAKPKLKADAKNLESKIRDMKRALRDPHLTHPEKVKLKADIAAAEAKLRRLQGEINQLHGKEVNIWIKTYRVTYYSSKGSLGHAPTNPKQGSGAPGSSFTSWSAAQNAMLDGGGTSRTGGPTPVNVEAPIVDTRVFLDSREIRSVARSTVLDENRRNAYRARVGRR